MPIEPTPRRQRTFKQKWALTSLSNKLTVIATLVIAIATVVNLVVARAMWVEMHNSGIDTKNLAAAAKDQATSTHDLAVAAGKQADAAGQQAAAAKGQSDNTAKLADAASKQARAAVDLVQKLQAGVDQTAKLATAAANANTIAAQAMEAQTRPWIGIDGAPQNVSGSATNNPPSANVGFDLTLRNYGQSPAVFSRPTTTANPFAVFGVQVIPRISLFEEHNMCLEADRDIVDLRRTVTIVSPGVDGVSTQHFSASLFPPPPIPFGSLILIGCIAYQGLEAVRIICNLCTNLTIPMARSQAFGS